MNDDLSVVPSGNKIYIHVFSLFNDFNTNDLAVNASSSINTTSDNSSSSASSSSSGSSSSSSASLTNKLNKMKDDSNNVTNDSTKSNWQSNISSMAASANITENENFSGGVYSWYFGEWNGNKTWDESEQNETDTYAKNFVKMTSLGSQDKVTITGDSSNPTTYISNPWGMDMWHGTSAIYRNGTFNNDGTPNSQQIKYSSSYVGKDTQKQALVFCSSKIGGDAGSMIPSTSMSTDTVSLGSIGYLSNSTTQSLNTGGGITGNAAGFSGSASITYNTGFTAVYHDLIDMNGTGCADQIIQDLGSTNMTVINNEGGGFNGSKTVENLFPYFRLSHNTCTAFGASVGVTGSTKITSNPNGKKTHSLNEASASWGGGISGSSGTSKKLIDFIDMKGDGLPDQVLRNDTSYTELNPTSGSSFKVNLNTGTSKFNSEGWSEKNNDELANCITLSNMQSATFNVSAGGSVGFEDTTLATENFVGATASLNMSVSNTFVTQDLMNITGEGAPSEVVKNNGGDYFRVRYNMGDHFTDYDEWSTPKWDSGDGIDISHCLSNDISSIVSSLGGGSLSGLSADIGGGTVVDFSGIPDAISFSGSYNFTIGATVPVKIVFLPHPFVFICNP